MNTGKKLWNGFTLYYDESHKGVFGNEAFELIVVRNKA